MERRYKRRRRSNSHEARRGKRGRRAELSALERDEHVAEWISLADLQSAQLAPNETKREDGRGHRHEGGIRKASRDIGIDRDDVRRATTDEAETAAVEDGS